MRFAIRDILWLTLAVGLAAGWWADHRRTDAVLDQEAKRFDAMHWTVIRTGFDWATDVDHWVDVEMPDGSISSFGPLSAYHCGSREEP